MRAQRYLRQKNVRVYQEGLSRRDIDIFRIDLWHFGGLVREMAWLGKYKEMFE